MKKLFLMVTFLFISYALFSQTVDGINLIDLKAQYIGMECTGFSATRFKVQLDFGQETKFGKTRHREIQTEKCRPLYVNSPIAALNLMYKFGYEVLESNEEGFLLKRRKRFDAKS